MKEITEYFTHETDYPDLDLAGALRACPPPSDAGPSTTASRTPPSPRCGN